MKIMLAPPTSDSAFEPWWFSEAVTYTPPTRNGLQSLSSVAEQAAFSLAWEIVLQATALLAI